MKVGDCLHFRGIQHDTCLAGVAMREKRRVIDRETQRRVGAPFTAVWPCHASGRAAGCGCLHVAPATQADVDAMDAENIRAMEAVLSGKCPDCGQPLKRVGRSWLHCPDCPGVTVHEHRGGRE